MRIIKALFADCETGGLDPKRNALLTLSGAVITLSIDDNGKINILNKGSYFDIKMKPIEGYTIEESALEINGLSTDEIDSFCTAEEGFNEFQNILDSNCFKFNKKDKMYLVGYNIAFDINFISEWFANFSPYLGSYLNWRKFDVFQKIEELDFRYGFQAKNGLKNLKLKTVCEHFGIEIDAHKSLDDIRATLELMMKLESYND